jgi:uncharacterized protein YfiM (DUF2279 family)
MRKDMDHPAVSVTPRSLHFATMRRFVLWLLIVLLGVGVMLAVDFAPVVPDPAVPTAEQAQRVRRVAERFRGQLRHNNGFATLRLDRADLASAARLASALEQFGRVESFISDNAIVVRVSRKFAFIWLNGEARLSPSSRGFPKTQIKVGDLAFGPWLSLWLINRVTDIARNRGVAVPPLDNLVRSVRVGPNVVLLDVHLPLGGAFANDFSNFRDQPVDATQTAKVYCRLISKSQKSPTTDFATLVRRAFEVRSSTMAIGEQNRAAFVALAMAVVSADAGRLAGDATQRAEKCPGLKAEARLAGRADLASHWALSAALSVSLGTDIGRAMGEWKELSDSRPGGSGFSFVDLAADRAGLAFARRATDPATSATTANRLRVADGEYLLPVRALALSEGLSERAFVAGFKATDSAQFAAAKSRIDAVLNNGSEPLD